MIGVYIHIPFCKTICSYCDFCKMFYNQKWSSSYLDNLEKEIDSLYQGEEVSTIYIGGGTPNCLSYNELERLFKIIKKFKKTKNTEYTIECNIELLNRAQIKLFKEYGIIAAREHMRASRFNEMRTAKKVDFLVSNYKTKLGLEGLEIIVNSDKERKDEIKFAKLRKSNDKRS